MSFLGTLFKGVGGFITGGPIGAAKALFTPAQQPQRLDSIITRSTQMNLIPPSYSSITTKQYPGAVDGGYAVGPAAQGTAVAPRAGCAMVWDGTRFRTTHPNKSTYVTRGGGTSRWPKALLIHPKGSECVTHRRMNPGNGRAAVHAVRRLAAFHHLAKRVEHQLQRIAKPRVSRRGAHPSGCGCGKCK